MTAQNLALQLLEDQGESTDEYDGMCGELVDAIIHWLGEDRVSIMHVDAHDNDLVGPCELWRYHMVPVIDGIVHDAWVTELILPPVEYAKLAFPTQSLRLSFYGVDGSIGEKD